jgi:hypothetical protein
MPGATTQGQKRDELLADTSIPIQKVQDWLGADHGWHDR